MVTKTCSPVFLKFKIKFNLKHFYISFLVNPSNQLSKENLQKAINNVLTESVKRCHRSVTVKEIGKVPIIAVCMRNFIKGNNLMTVKNIFIIAHASSITEYK